jgi:hypothetical protein
MKRSEAVHQLRIQPSTSCLETILYPSHDLSKKAILSLLVEDDHVTGMAKVRPNLNRMNGHLLPRYILPIHVLANIFTYGSLSDLYQWCRVKREWAAAVHHQDLWRVKCEKELTVQFISGVLLRISPDLPENVFRTLYRWSMPPSGISSAPCVSCGHPNGHKLANLFVCPECSKKPEFAVLTKRQIGMQCGVSFQQASVWLNGNSDRKTNAFLMKTVWGILASILRELISVQLLRARLSDHWKYHPFFDSFLSQRSKINTEKDTAKAAELVIDFKRLLIEQAKVSISTQPLFYRAWMIACQNEVQ